VRILWLDNDEATLTVWGRSLQQALRAQEIQVEVDFENWGERVVQRLSVGEYDVLILDLALGDQRYLKSGFDVLKEIETSGVRIATVVFSGHISTRPDGSLAGSYSEDLQRRRNELLGIVPKSPEGLTQLASVLVEFQKRPPVTIIALSDVHIGLLQESDASEDQHMRVVEREFERIRRLENPKYLLIAGDLVWKEQRPDLVRARRFIDRVRRALGLEAPGRFHVCPGNHDVVRPQDGSSTQPWVHFAEFIRDLAAHDTKLARRYSDQFGKLRKFRFPEDLLGIEVAEDGSVLFASLNSVVPGLTDGRSTVGEDQWSALEGALERDEFRSAQLKVAFFHHPIYAAPSLHSKGDEPVLAESGSALSRLARLGFDLILHGHSHYPCLHSHESTVLKGVGEAVAQRQVVVSLPTFGGHTWPAAPFQQYCVVRVGHLRRPTGERVCELKTRIFDATAQDFVPGQAVATTLTSHRQLIRD
jgi:3',5'-cyclic AMP phosphodiesterase CpdA